MGHNAEKDAPAGCDQMLCVDLGKWAMRLKAERDALSQEAAADDWERHVNTIPLSPEMEARLGEVFPLWAPPSDTQIFDEVKRQQDVRFMAEAIEELRELGVDLADGDAS